MAIVEQPYLDLLQDIMENGTDKEDRTGTGTRSVFGRQMRFDLRAGFPAVTTKRLAFKTMVTELLWFISGDTNIKKLQEHKCNIWDAWANDRGELGPVYGNQWRGHDAKETHPWKKDQLADVIEQIKTNPDSRRHVVSAWNVSEIDQMALPPCHMMFQFYVDKRGLSLHFYQRSGDAFLGVPFNFASYALLLHIVADLTGYEAVEVVHTIGDAHVYSNHFDQVREQLTRTPYDAPRIAMPAKCDSINDYELGKMTADDFKLVGYKHHPTIKAPVAV